MACSRCQQLNCNGGCIKSPFNKSCSQDSIISRNNSFENKSEGRDGESAYKIYVREGGTLTEEEWLESLKGNSYIPINSDNYFDI